MKQLWIIGALVALLSSCTESVELQNDANEEQLGGISITATITMPQSEDSADTRISTEYGDEDWLFTWEAADTYGHVYALCNNGNDDYETIAMTGSGVSDGASTATFSGVLPDGTESYYIIYSSNVDISSLDSPKFSLDLSSGQDGSLNNLVMASKEYTVDDSNTIAPYLYHVSGFIALDLSLENIPEHWHQVTIQSVEIAGFNTSATVDLSAENFAFYSDEASSTFKAEFSDKVSEDEDEEHNDSHDMGKIYFNIIPTTLASDDDITITVYFSNGTTLDIIKELNKEVAFERAEFTTLSTTYDFDEMDDECTITIADVATTKASALRYDFGGNDADAADINFDTNTKSYTIYTERHLAALAALTNAGKTSGGEYDFTLGNDITLTRSWTPIGYYSSTKSTEVSFEGVFDGAGYKIHGEEDGVSTVIDDTYVSLGIFGYISGESTVVKNVVVENCHFELNIAGTHIGILAGTIQGGATMLNCGCDSSSSATINDRGAVGGLAGAAYNCFIYNCYNQGSVTGTNKNNGSSASSNNINIGGLCGKTYLNNSYFTTIKNCYNVGTVTTEQTESSNTYIFIYGGIIGMATTLDVYSNLYWWSGCGANGYAGRSTQTAADVNTKESSDMQGPTFAGTLNGNITSLSIDNASNWTAATDNDYPTFDFTTN
ncbi:MAG: hypothetical protein R3Y16_06015 [Rikenellaceae bacterium]